MSKSPYGEFFGFKEPFSNYNRKREPEHGCTQNLLPLSGMSSNSILLQIVILKLKKHNNKWKSILPCVHWSFIILW